MAPDSPSSDPTSATSPSLPSGSLTIPESRDGFFGYQEEKSQQHVRFDLYVADGCDLRQIVRFTRNIGHIDAARIPNPMLPIL